MDQPSMFSLNNEMWPFGPNGGMYDHGSRSGSGGAFDHPTPALVTASLATSPTLITELHKGSVSPGVRKVDDDGMLDHDLQDHELPIDDALSDRPSCGQPEESEDDGRTITAPSTPFA